MPHQRPKFDNLGFSGASGTGTGQWAGPWRHLLTELRSGGGAILPGAGPARPPPASGGRSLIAKIGAAERLLGLAAFEPGSSRGRSEVAGTRSAARGGCGMVGGGGKRRPGGAGPQVGEAGGCRGVGIAVGGGRARGGAGHPRRAALPGNGRGSRSSPAPADRATMHAFIHSFSPLMETEPWRAPALQRKELPRRRGTRERAIHPQLFAWGQRWCVEKKEKCWLD